MKSSRGSVRAITGARTSSSRTRKIPIWAPACTPSGRRDKRTDPRPGCAPAKSSSSSIEAIIRQDIVDIMLTSVSNLERLVRRNAFAGSNVKPVIRANDTTDIWRHRGAAHALSPSRPFRTASLAHVRPLTDLGLYSITFTNDVEADIASLEAFREFRADAEAHGLSYFLEVFKPNVDRGLSAETMPHFVNDAIVRCLAGLTEAERPKFLKIAYNGPRALEELASYRSGSCRRRARRRRRHDARLLRTHPSGAEVRRARRSVRPQDQSRRIAARHRPADAGGVGRGADAARSGRGLSRHSAAGNA